MGQYIIFMIAFLCYVPCGSKRAFSVCSAFLMRTVTAHQLRDSPNHDELGIGISLQKGNSHIFDSNRRAQITHLSICSYDPRVKLED